ncbi:MAG TPA: histidine phosphatase family protein, partial [Afifellaceae bacterium]|nr:histidine phosphatase family protein [Afifellaceae bacterium]
MPRLCLLRHAKSDWFAGASGDFDRPISPRGERDAPLIAAHIAAAGWRPDLILCSPAKRCRQTFDIVAGFLNGDPDVSYPAGLYDASSFDYTGLIRTHGGNAQTLMIIGHNPMIHETALRLAIPAISPAANELARKFPTCAVALLDFQSAWEDLADNSGKLLAFVKPVDLRS